MIKAILLAEDSRDDELFFKRVLQQSGIQNPVFVVRDGDQAIAYLNGAGPYGDREQFPMPSALFLDLKMARVDGREVLRWLKGQPQFRGLLVVVLTHLDEARGLFEAYSLGANSFLSKPFTQSDMENLVQHFPGYWMLGSGEPGVPVIPPSGGHDAGFSSDLGRT